MPDNLHTRIAKVLYQRGTARDDVEDGWVWTWEQESEYEQRSWLEDADAVIAALGLRQEWAVADSDGDHVYVGTVEENADKYTVQPGDHKETRYVTEWTADA